MAKSNIGSRRGSIRYGILPAPMPARICRFALLLLWVGCSSEPAPDVVDDDDVADDDDSGDDADSALPVRPPLPWKDDPCIGITSAAAAYADRVATWVEQDALSPVGAGGVVVAGSSSIRRWDGVHRELSPWGHVVQRGFGGARLYDVAAWAPELVLAHDPRGVVVFAGTNDIAGGASAADVVTAYRCLAQQVYSLEPSVPLYFIGITPTPSRWANWDRSSAVNEAVAGFAAEHPDLRYIDTPAAFLGTGEPPDAGLFVEDHLHLNVAGYALWTTVILDALEGWERADVGCCDGARYGREGGLGTGQPRGRHSD
jgi:lysophospholipase L1-like esterase